MKANKFTILLVPVAISVALLLLGFLADRKSSNASVLNYAELSDRVAVEQPKSLSEPHQNHSLNIHAHSAPLVSTPSESSEAREFQQARDCHEASTNRADWQVRVDYCDRLRQDPDGIAECNRDLPLYLPKIHEAEKVLSDCSAVPLEIERNFFELSKRVATHGNSDAQLCYLNSRTKSIDFSQSDIDDYKSVDVNYINDGLSRGDWRLVVLLGQSRRSFQGGETMRRYLTDGQPYIVYQMNRLLRLGAEGEFAASLDWRGVSLREQLSAGQVAEAEDWAKVVYEQSFANAPRLTEMPTVCEDDSVGLLPNYY